MFYSLINKNNVDISLEDTRTSTIIGNLLHLPDKLIWQILRDSCYGGRENLPSDAGLLKEYQFWPKWEPANTYNSTYVEPDVVLFFEDADIIIEVKRSDTQAQSEYQWTNEFKSYQNTYGNSKKPVFLIALGGNGSRKDIYKVQSCNNRIVLRCSWLSIRSTLEKEKKQNSGNILRTLNELINACNLMGFNHYKWLSDRPWAQAYNIEYKEKNNE